MESDKISMDNTQDPTSENMQNSVNLSQISEEFKMDVQQFDVKEENTITDEKSSSESAGKIETAFAFNSNTEEKNQQPFIASELIQEPFEHENSSSHNTYTGIINTENNTALSEDKSDPKDSSDNIPLKTDSGIEPTDNKEVTYSDNSQEFASNDATDSPNPEMNTPQTTFEAIEETVFSGAEAVNSDEHYDIQSEEISQENLKNIETYEIHNTGAQDTPPETNEAQSMDKSDNSIANNPKDDATENLKEHHDFSSSHESEMESSEPTPNTDFNTDNTYENSSSNITVNQTEFENPKQESQDTEIDTQIEHSKKFNKQVFDSVENSSNFQTITENEATNEPPSNFSDSNLTEQQENFQETSHVDKTQIEIENTSYEGAPDNIDQYYGSNQVKDTYDNDSMETEHVNYISKNVDLIQDEIPQKQETGIESITDSNFDQENSLNNIKINKNNECQNQNNENINENSIENNTENLTQLFVHHEEFQTSKQESSSEESHSNFVSSVKQANESISKDFNLSKNIENTYSDAQEQIDNPSSQTTNMTISQPTSSETTKDSTPQNTEVIITENDKRKSELTTRFHNNSKKFAEIIPFTSEQILESYDISTKTLKPHKQNADLPENILMLDCRTPAEQSMSIVHNAITKAQFEKQYNISENAPNTSEDTIESFKSTLIVPYCTLGVRSGMYCRKLKAMGFDNVMNNDGILMWLHAGGKVVKNVQNSTPVFTNEVHTFSPNIDFAPTSYKTQPPGLMFKIKKYFALICDLIYQSLRF